ncbi:MAG: peptidoglycan-binding protein, partial [Acetobacterales bacterium]
PPQPSLVPPPPDLEKGEASRVIQAPVGRGGENRREDVASVEALLARRGYLDTDATDGPTGYFGARALRAVERFQRDHGLHVDGRLDPDGPTLAVLKAPADGTDGGPAAHVHKAGFPVLAAPALIQGARTLLPLLGGLAAEAARRNLLQQQGPGSQDQTVQRQQAGPAPQLPPSVPEAAGTGGPLIHPPADPKEPDPGFTPQQTLPGLPGFTPEEREMTIEGLPDQAQLAIAAILLESRGTHPTPEQVDGLIGLAAKHADLYGLKWKHVGGGHHPRKGHRLKELLRKHPQYQPALKWNARPDGSLIIFDGDKKMHLDIQHMSTLVDRVTPIPYESRSLQRLHEHWEEYVSRNPDESYAILEFSKDRNAPLEEWMEYAEKRMAEYFKELYGNPPKE